MRFSLLLACSLLAGSLLGQGTDTLTVFQLNLLNYRINTGNCNATTNPANAKDNNLRIIVRATDPDILAFNEIGNNSANIGQLLSNALNTDGVTKYASTFYAGTSSLINHLYYNTEKLGYLEHDQITQALNNSNLVRSIDIYKLYYKEPKLDAGDDTTYLTVFVAHLKAGNSTSDEVQRTRATEAIMDYLANNPTRNFLLAGDLNIYNASEDAFDLLINSAVDSLNFEDPINEIGEWDNNSSFSRFHTQSTRTTSTSSGCFSGGGFDNRFDFILASKAVMDGRDFIEYLGGTYQAYGQDGIRFNGSMQSPTNPNLPSGVQNALYQLSDHLPVVMQLEVTFRNDTTTSVQSIENNWSKQIKLVQPIRNNQLELTYRGSQNLTLQVFDVLGKPVMTKPLQPGRSSFSLPNNLPNGLYILKYTDNQSVTFVQKAIKI